MSSLQLDVVVPSSSEELKESVKKASIKAVAVLIGAALLAWAVDGLSNFSSSLSTLAKILNHHACSTNGGFVALALGVSCVGLLLATHSMIEKVSRYLLRAFSDLSGHITLAGLGFAVVLWDKSLDPRVYGIGVLWLVSGWFCLVIGTLFERRIEAAKSNTWEVVAAPWLLVGVVLLGFAVLALVPKAVDVKPPPSCEQNRH